MVVKINSYYKNEIDKAKEGILDDKNKIKSPYIFTTIYFLCIIYELTLLMKEISLLVVLLYALPLLIGAIYEVFLLKKLKKEVATPQTIHYIMGIGVVRMTNFLLLLMCMFLIGGQVIIPDMLSYEVPLNSMNKYFILLYLIAMLCFVSLFLVGYIFERKQVQARKIKIYYQATMIGAGAVLGYFVLKKLSYNYIIIVISIAMLLICYAIGKIYFRYKFFDKKINDNDKIVDYKL